MSRPALVPYYRQPGRVRRRSDFLQSIIERQKRGMLLSEIGVEFGSRTMVRSAVLCWLFERPA